MAHRMCYVDGMKGCTPEQEGQDHISEEAADKGHLSTATARCSTLRASKRCEVLSGARGASAPLWKVNSAYPKQSAPPKFPTLNHPPRRSRSSSTPLHNRKPRSPLCNPLSRRVPLCCQPPHRSATLAAHKGHKGPEQSRAYLTKHWDTEEILRARRLGLDLDVTFSDACPSIIGTPVQQSQVRCEACDVSWQSTYVHIKGNLGTNKVFSYGNSFLSMQLLDELNECHYGDAMKMVRILSLCP
jgi:hypothetical protein